MKKVAWTSAAFAKRVQMTSNVKLFVIVEGKNFDKPFYDAVLRSYSSDRFSDFEIRSVEQIDRNGSHAGGKQRALAIHDDYYPGRKLTRSDGHFASAVVFFLDRDYDHLSGSATESKHIVYTQYCDVEAEIFRHGDLARALCGTLSLTEREASTLYAIIDNPLRQLAEAWSSWLLLCVLAIGLKSRGKTRPSNPSPINCGPNGSVDTKSETSILADIRKNSTVTASSSREAQLRQLYAELQLHGRLEELVRGKWVPSYLAALVSAHHPLSSRDQKRFISAVLPVLSTQLPEQGWAIHWHDALDAL